MEQANIGGDKLRSLRRGRHDERGKRLTLESLASAAGFDYRTISDIERGVAQRPPLETLHRIFTTLEQFGTVSVEDRNTVLQAYGYHPILIPPTDAEIAQASAAWAEQYCHMKLPGYLVTYTQHLVAWNRYALLILNITDNERIVKQFRNITIFDLAFNPLFIAASRIENAKEFIPKLLYTVKAEMQMFRYEKWYQDLIAETSQQYSLFKTIWESLPEDLPSVNVRTHGPIHITHPDGELLKFQILGIDFASDPRFRVVQYHPADSSTIKIWNQWVEMAESAGDPDA